jgi:hypothetical protein
MHFIDRSPGGFLAFAGVVVYGVIGVEAWMWTEASVVAVAATLTLIAFTAGCICFAVVRLMEDVSGSDTGVVDAEQPAVLPSRRELAAPRPRRAARPHRPAHVA